MGIAFALRASVETSQFLFPDDGSIPNNPRLPMIIHSGAFAAPSTGEAIRRIEERVTDNGWTAAWQNGIYPFPHYHATCHEALLVARGWGRVRFGGQHGVVLKIAAGDVAVLPAGTGHQAIALSEDFMVIGAYPNGASYDLCRGTAQEHASALARIAAVPLPDRDPLLGDAGGVAKLWR